MRQFHEISTWWKVVSTALKIHNVIYKMTGEVWRTLHDGLCLSWIGYIENNYSNQQSYESYKGRL